MQLVYLFLEEWQSLVNISLTFILTNDGAKYYNQ